MICNICGAHNSGDARACAKCGSGIIAICPACAADVQAGARFCSACGHSLFSQTSGAVGTNRENPRLAAGERKQVTILFADFSGFTAFSSQLDPEDLRDNMNSIWAKLDAIIAAHGGTPEKHSGDAIMAVFGGRRSREEDPTEAVRAALEMQAWLVERKSENGRPSLQMRIGIHTGLAVVGPVEQTGEFLATGDSVNLASRLEQSAPVGGVLISRETYRHVYGFFDAQALPPLTVKGKVEPLETYVILRAKPRGLALQMRGIEGVETELIGRGQELGRVQEIFENVMRHRTPQVLTVVGEGGIGKSRLLREFQKWTDLRPQYFRVFCGRAGTETFSLPFALIRELFSARFEIQETDPVFDAKEKFEQGLVGLLGAGPVVRPHEELMLDIHLIGQLLGFDFSSSPRLHDILGDAEQIRQSAFLAFSRVFAAITDCPVAEKHPRASAILLVLEDLHWADDGSLDLIQDLARNCQGVPLMILCSARPAFFERRATWCKGLANAARLNLEPLSLSESGVLVETILQKAREIPPPLRELITEGAEGNPFYIEEMIKMLMDQKVILPQAEHWRIDLTRLVSARVPSTLTGVLQARMDGLSSTERVVLQRASVVGRAFWDSAVEYIGSEAGRISAPGPLFESTLDRDEIAPALEKLREKGLVFRRELTAFTGCVEYTFKHELLRNVAYESLLKKSRRHHHARMADWLVSRGGARMQEIAGLVAAHFEQASQLVEAAEWHGRAGQQARLGYAPAIASGHFQRALQLLPQDPVRDREFQKQQFEWQEGLGETFGAQARFSEALEAYAAMRALARQLGDPLAEARAWNGMAFLHERNGDNRASIHCAEQAEALARAASGAGHAERVRALHYKGWAFYRLGDAPEVLALGEETLNLCAGQGDRRGTATSFKLLGVARLQLGHYLEADRFFARGLDIFQDLGDRRNAAAMWSNRGESARACGDHKAAAALYEKALAIAHEIGHRESEMIYLANLAAARLELEQFNAAEADLRQVISQTLSPNSCALSEVFTFLGEALLGQGKLSEAAKMARQAITLAQESESSLYLGGAWRTLGRIGAGELMIPSPQSAAANASEPPAADPPRCFAESLRIFQLINAEGERARTLRAWAQFELQLGLVVEGRKKLCEARDIFRKLGAVFELAATEKLLQEHVGVAETTGKASQP